MTAAFVDNLAMARSMFAKQVARLVAGDIPTKGTPTTSGRADDATLTYATSLLRNARDELTRADAKASILLAASGVVVGALLAGLIAGTWTPFKMHIAGLCLWWVGVGEAAIGIWCLAWVVYPRSPRHRPRESWAVAYYGDVIGFQATSELVTALRRSAETNIEQVADQLRQISRIAHHKYRLIRWGMRMLLLAALTTAMAVLISL
jgi:hypothetical protein